MSHRPLDDATTVVLVVVVFVAESLVVVVLITVGTVVKYMLLACDAFNTVVQNVMSHSVMFATLETCQAEEDGSPMG